MVNNTALAANGKPIQLGDFVTLSGFVTAVSGYGSNAVLTLRTANAGSTINVHSNEVNAAQSL